MNTTEKKCKVCGHPIEPASYFGWRHSTRIGKHRNHIIEPKEEQPNQDKRAAPSPAPAAENGE